MILIIKSRLILANSWTVNVLIIKMKEIMKVDELYEDEGFLLVEWQRPETKNNISKYLENTQHTLGGPIIMPVQCVRVISSSFSRPHDIVPSPQPLCPCSNSSKSLKFLGTTENNKILIRCEKIPLVNRIAQFTMSCRIVWQFGKLFVTINVHILVFWKERNILKGYISRYIKYDEKVQ